MTTSPAAAARTADLKRDLLARHLRIWAPSAVQRARRATYAHGYADLDGGRTAEVAWRVLADQPGLGRGRELMMVAVAEDPTATAGRLAAAQRDSPGTAASVHTVRGSTDAGLAPALRAAGATRFPVFGYLDAGAATVPPALATVAALGVGQPVEVLLVLAPTVLPDLAAVRSERGAAGDPGHGGVDGDRVFGDARWRAVVDRPGERRRAFLADGYRSALHDVGFPLVTMVELVTPDDADGELLVFATTSGRSLEGFKESLWAVGEEAGVRYRDPGADLRRTIDVVASPHSGPLRRELLARLEAAGRCTVTELRTFALTHTVYRAADASRALTGLLSEGAVTRTPEHGRLGGDVVISLPA